MYNGGFVKIVIQKKNCYTITKILCDVIVLKITLGITL